MAGVTERSIGGCSTSSSDAADLSFLSSAGPLAVVMDGAPASSLKTLDEGGGTGVTEEERGDEGGTRVTEDEGGKEGGTGVDREESGVGRRRGVVQC